MKASQFISVRESAQVLGISEKKIMDLIESKELQAYKIADQFLRLKRSDVFQLKTQGSMVEENVKHGYTRNERMKDFFYYNDFYLISLLIILALLYIIFFIR